MTLFVLIAACVIAVAVFAVSLLTRGQALVEVDARFATPLGPAEARAEGLDGLLEAMAAEEYALAGTDGSAATFTRRHRPRWTIWIAAVGWPLGLLALLRRTWVTVEVGVQTDEGGGSVITLRGTVTQRLWDRLRWMLGDRSG